MESRNLGYHPQCFTEVTIEVRDAVWGDIETGRHTVLVPGDPSPKFPPIGDAPSRNAPNSHDYTPDIR